MCSCWRTTILMMKRMMMKKMVGFITGRAELLLCLSWGFPPFKKWLCYVLHSGVSCAVETPSFCWLAHTFFCDWSSPNSMFEALSLNIKEMNKNQSVPRLLLDCAQVFSVTGIKFRLWGEAAQTKVTNQNQQLTIWAMMVKTNQQVEITDSLEVVWNPIGRRNLQRLAVKMQFHKTVSWRLEEEVINLQWQLAW